MKIALCMIVKGDDTEAALLSRCLESVSSYVDGIFITRTHKKGEKPNKAIANIVAQYAGAHLSDFEWCNDFAAARNFNFSQAPKEYDYIMWSDADDVWRGLDSLKQTIEKHPFVEAFGIWYLYDWDEYKKPTVVHKKTMVIKNDGCAQWVGALHEDLLPTRQVNVHLIEGIDRLHLSDAPRVAAAAKRNLEIAKAERKKKPEDPRAYWDLANSQLGVADYAGALKSYRDFVASSQSEEEKYLAYLRMGDVARAQGNIDEAIRSLRIAIGVFPMLPDAYYQLAYVYFTTKNWDKAEEYCLMGLKRRPQLHKMIVYNPRDYDYNPMMMLAQVYFHKNRPDLMLPLLKGCLKIYPDDKRLKGLVKEGEEEYSAMERALKRIEKLQTIKDKARLKRELERLPADLASHPAISVLRNQNFIKTESSGRDLVIYCGNTIHQWTPSGGMIGGSEEAVINLAREFAKLGWNVTVYNNCGHKPVYDPSGRGAGNPPVTYRPFWEWNYRDKQDVTILWRWVKPVDADINTGKLFIDLHDVPVAGEFTPERLAKITKIMVKTQFHRSFLPSVPDDKIAIIPNGIDFSLLESTPPIEKDPYLIINTSSPDRSMDVLPKLFTEVKKRVPQARMQWAYGWELFEAAWARDTKKMAWMRDTKKAIQDAGIEVLGKLSQIEVGKLYQRASFFAYPSEFAEIDCISAKKAMACGCQVVATDFGAIPEAMTAGAILIHSEKTKDNWSKPYQFHFGLEDDDAQQEWVDRIIEALNGPRWSGNLEREKAQQYAWPKIASHWNELLTLQAAQRI